MPTGRCLCGGIRYAIDGAIGPIDHCHCSMCRRAHGAPFSTFGRVRRADLRILAGSELLTGHASSEHVIRSFGSRCGTRLFVRHAALPDADFVAIGSLDEEPEARPEAHIFVASKAGWYTIADDLPQHDGYPFGDD